MIQDTSAQSMEVPLSRHRRSNRLEGYDYSQPGAYYVTIVAQRRRCLFGTIVDGDTSLSEMGLIADEHWRAIPQHFPQVELGAFVIMPNHIHGIVRIIELEMSKSGHVGATHWVAPTREVKGPKPVSVGAIIGAYKMSVTREIKSRWNTTGIWQRSYYEHIIRDDDEHQLIHDYIEANPQTWSVDHENPLLTKESTPCTLPLH
jgi:REP element-mobilizing transposase RayT